MPPFCKVPVRSPKISVILPVYNAESTILTAVDSILNGHFKQIEVIVADDGSGDRTLQKLETIRDHRLRILKGTHQGVAATANRAASEAQAEWVARMDADDIAHSHRLKSQWQYAQRTGCNLVSGWVRIVDLKGKPVKTMQRYENWLNSLTHHERIMASRFIELPLPNPSILAKRSFFLNGCRKGPFPEDYDHWLTMLSKPEVKAGKVRSTILDWCDHPRSLTRSDRRYSEQAFTDCKRTHLLKGPLKRRKRVALWGAGQTGKPWLRWLLEEGFQVPYVVDVSPKKIGQTIHGVTVIAPEELPSPSKSNPTLLGAVGAAGAREQIKTFLNSRGHDAVSDILFVA
jgi:glycosyltransferase involved in cell wall biosynthesis